MRVFIERGKGASDPGSLIFHVDREISIGNQRTYFRHDYMSRHEELSQSCGQNAVKIVEGVFRISGVLEVEISAYRLKVTKAPAFGWLEIEPFISDTLREALNEEEAVLQDIETTDQIRHEAIKPYSVPAMIAEQFKGDLPAELPHGGIQA